MFSRDTWKEIFDTIRKNKLRTFLTGFTMALGIFIVVILVGFTNGLQNTFEKFFGDDATNTLFIFPGRTSMPYKGYTSNRRIQFDNSDLEDIEETFAMFIDYITPRITRSSLVNYKGESNNYTNRGVAPGHQFSEKTIIMKGRFLNENDISIRAKYAVIGRLVAKDLFKDEEPIGKFIIMGDIAFKVIGVFQDDGGDNEERLIYIPYTTRQLIEKGNDKIAEIVVGFNPSIGYAGAMALEKNITKLLKEKKYIAREDRSGIFIRNIADELKQNQQFAQVLGFIALFFAIGTIVAGIIGVSNIMIFVVKERTKEIGIRKALGASPRVVISTILLEATTITILSGFSGMFAGVIILQNLGGKLEDYFITNPYIDLGFALGATLILIIFGSIAGYIPAKRAARIKPIVALRDE
jgi:putative ABC transport system permease protein